MRGFVTLPLVIITLVLVAALGFFLASGKLQTKVSVSPTPSPTPSVSASIFPNPSPSPSPTPTVTPHSSTSSTPLVDCVGPDGKYVSLTQKACDDFKKAWTPSPSPSPSTTTTQSSTSSGGCSTSTDLGNLTVSIQASSGSLSGDAAVTMSNGSGSCAGSDSRLPIIQIISQGSTSTTFNSFRPGKFHISVNYHGNNYDSDATVNSGGNSVTVTVSN